MDRASSHGRTGRSGSIERHGYIVRGALTCRAHVRATAARGALAEQSAIAKSCAVLCPDGAPVREDARALWHAWAPRLECARCCGVAELRARFG